METFAGVFAVGRKIINPSDHGRGRAHPATLVDHLGDGGGVAGEEGLHGSVSAVADPAVEPELTGVLYRPVPEEHALHPPLHHHPNLYPKI